jgi:hypothetical protein
MNQWLSIGKKRLTKSISTIIPKIWKNPRAFDTGATSPQSVRVYTFPLPGGQHKTLSCSDELGEPIRVLWDGESKYESQDKGEGAAGYLCTNRVSPREL